MMSEMPANLSTQKYKPSANTFSYPFASCSPQRSPSTAEARKLAAPFDSRKSFQRSTNNADGPLTPAVLRLDPTFDPLRNDQRFEKLAADLAPNTADK
jgi:hypothetical protein